MLAAVVRVDTETQSLEKRLAGAVRLKQGLLLARTFLTQSLLARVAQVVLAVERKVFLECKVQVRP